MSDLSTLVLPTGITLFDERAPGRADVQSFIHHHYARAYGADVYHFLPRLMALYSSRSALIAALGFRPAAAQALYLENYLDAPVEQALASATGGVIDRAGLVEVGNLVTAQAGGARWLITALTAYLQAAGAAWAVFTAVRELRNAFTRLGIELVQLADADSARLAPAERAQWGRYYDTQPMVVAASVSQSFAAIEARFERARDRHQVKPLWHGALVAGAAARAA
jgi:hypothetical protein